MEKKKQKVPWMSWKLFWKASPALTICLIISIILIFVIIPVGAVLYLIFWFWLRDKVGKMLEAENALKPSL